MLVEALETISLETSKHKSVLYTACSSGSLFSRFLRDELRREDVAALFRLVADLPFQPCVDYRDYVWNCDGGLRDIGGQYDSVFRGMPK